MNYIEVRFHINQNQEIASDLLAAMLAEVGFESFVPDNEGMTAYCAENQFNKNYIDEIISQIPVECQIKHRSKLVKGENWNQEWERHYFQPIVIGDRCVIHSSFHHDVPNAEFDILIDPKMAFGTGHHETTSLIIQEILNHSMQGKTVLDMGCGTAVLAILAMMRGGKSALAIDIDQWAIENAIENIQLNNQEGIKILAGDATLLTDQKFDVILANINRNILLHDMDRYVHCLNNEGSLFMSGFYVEDLPMIREKATQLGLTYVHHTDKNRWCAARFDR